MRPLLPDYKHIEQYLKTIDKNRWYTNFGPLALSLEERFCEFFHVPSGGVVSLANGTAGLVNALRAFDLPRGSYCLVPSWTFVATAAAPVAAGMKPYFIDVDEKSWAITPEIVKKAMKETGGTVGAVIAVAPFGSPVNTREWDNFTKETGIPVIIDAAAGFDAFSHIKECSPGSTPIMISLHATKLCGCGEGGIMVSRNTNIIRRIRELSNFGFAGKKEIRIPGTNAKMSEYNAAVAHAALDNWHSKRADWINLRTKYLHELKKLGSLLKNIWISEDWAASTCNIRLATDNAEDIVIQLAEEGIESRRWWGKGCHAQPAYSKYPRAKLPVTEALGASVISLPFSIDISDSDIGYVVSSLRQVLEQKNKRKAG